MDPAQRRTETETVAQHTARRATLRAAFFQQRNSLILNAAGEGIYGLDLEGRVTFANPAAAKMTGHTVEELLGQHMHSLVHHTSPEGRRLPRESCAIYAAFVDGAVHQVDDEVFWRKDGTCFPVHYSSTPIRESGELVGAVVVFRDVSEQKRSEERLRNALFEVERLKDQLQAENQYLRQEIRDVSHFGDIVGSSGALREALSAVERVAPTDATVLVQGESGSGKELIARAVHNHSQRRDGPLVKVNCGALAPSLVNSELFGHEKGAFTGALAQRRGRFELASGGTLFLDEIGELPLETQATLLRVLQDGEFERVGGVKTVKVDVRLIAATHRDLPAMVAAGSFRADLYYRLCVFPVGMPPLRERLSDVPALVEAFLGQLSLQLGRTLTGVTPQSMARLMAYSFPGNVRELHNLLERAAILAAGPVLEIGELDRGSGSASEVTAAAHAGAGPGRRGSPMPAAAPEPGMPEVGDKGTWDLKLREREHVVSALQSRGWKIAGNDGAAAALGLHPNTLRSRMKKLGIPTRGHARRD